MIDEYGDGVDDYQKTLDRIEKVVNFIDILPKNHMSLGSYLKEELDNVHSESFGGYLPVSIDGVNVIDFGNVHSGIILGGGEKFKTNLTHLIMSQLILLNDPKIVNIILLEDKNKLISREFSKAPHVIKYEYRIKNYVKVLEEVLEDVEKRKRTLDLLGVDTYKDVYSNELPFPNLFIIIDDLNFTLKKLNYNYANGIDEPESLINHATYNLLIDLVYKVKNEAAKVGIHLIMTASRTTDIPTLAIHNCDLKILIKSDEKSVYAKLYYPYDLTVPKGYMIYQPSKEMTNVLAKPLHLVCYTDETEGLVVDLLQQLWENLE